MNQVKWMLLGAAWLLVLAAWIGLAAVVVVRHG